MRKMQLLGFYFNSSFLCAAAYNYSQAARRRGSGRQASACISRRIVFHCGPLFHISQGSTGKPAMSLWNR